jgi:hypothetical protein
MKRSVIIFLSIFLISLASAIPKITFQQNETQPGETIFATITTTGVFAKDITESDIKFLEGRKEVFFESDITHFNGTYYFYAYTTREGTFTLKISNILYNEDGNLQSTILEKNFSVQKESITEENITTTEILSIKPGFLKSSDELEINFINRGNSPLEINCPNQEVVLQPSESKKITFEQESQFELFSCSTYKEFFIPVIRPKPGDIIIPPTIHNLKSDPESITLNITIGESLNKQIKLFNFGDENFTDFEIASDFDFVKLKSLEALPGREIQNLSLTISPKLPGHFKGTINITYTQINETKTFFIPLDFFILPAGSDTSDFTISDLSCAGLNGNICTSGVELCNGTAEFTSLGEYCCKGNCVVKEIEKEGGGYGWLIGILIFLVLGAGGYYLYKRQKKIGPQKPEDQMKETSKKLDERVKGILDTKRIRGGLQRS